MYSPEVQSKLQQLRIRASQGEKLSEADMAWAVQVIRQGRVSAAAASEGARKKVAKAAIPDGDDLLKELGGL